MRTFSHFLSACLIALLSASTTLRADDKVIVHEWGTFTCLQDENGQAIDGINVDDEPVPQFVYEQGDVIVTAQYSQLKGNFGLPPYNTYFSKGWVPNDPQVTMRLETPVIYFYPPKGQTPASGPALDVSVDFHDGMLSQFYPYAQPENSHSILGQINSVVGSLSFGKGILYGMTSSLTWKGIRLGSTQKPVETDDKVWTTPREVSAPLLEVKAPGGWNGNIQLPEKAQAEHFLFYRGVGHLDSPLRVDFDFQIPAGAPKELFRERRFARVSPRLDAESLANYSESWLVDIRKDGSCAFSHRDFAAEFNVNATESAQMPPELFSLNSHHSFADDQYGADRLTKLKASMQDALVKEGLYPDEASAMLRTWELSYFKSPGLRFFYTAPRTWVDQVLPLKITGAPTEITRVMVGRIELISDAQKAALARLAAGPCPDLAAVKKAAEDKLENSKLPKDEAAAFYRGEKPLSELGITIPPLVQDYLDLGRFRDALIVHEQKLRPSGALGQFISDNRLAVKN